MDRDFRMCMLSKNATPLGTDGTVAESGTLSRTTNDANVLSHSCQSNRWSGRFVVARFRSCAEACGKRYSGSAEQQLGKSLASILLTQLNFTLDLDRNSKGQLSQSYCAARVSAHLRTEDVDYQIREAIDHRRLPIEARS